MECVICYVFLLLLCLLDAHYVLFTLFVFKFCKFGFYCCIFFLAILNGLMAFFDQLVNVVHHFSVFNNKPVSTRLSLKKLLSSRTFKDLLLSAGNNFDYSFSKVPYDSNLQKFERIGNGTTRLIIKIISQGLSFFTFNNPHQHLA